MEGGLKARTTLSARVKVAVPGWKEAIRAACAPLVEAKAITKHYEDRCVEIVAEQGPYIVLAPGVALAHARPEDGARTVALSAITLLDPVQFGHPSNDPVDVVFVFSSPGKDAHVGLLTSLSNHLISGLAERLRTAGSDSGAAAQLQEVIDDVV